MVKSPGTHLQKYRVEGLSRAPVSYSRASNVSSKERRNGAPLHLPPGDGEERRTEEMTIDLNKMKERLEAKRAELENSIADLTQAHPEPVGPLEANEPSQDPEDIAVDFEEIQKEQSLLVNQQALLTEVVRALERIEQGTYGICVDCGRPIPEKRLEAIPWAARDVQCEEQLEQRNLSGENA